MSNDNSDHHFEGEGASYLLGGLGGFDLALE